MLQGKQSIVWNPDAATSGSVPSEKPEASTAATDTDAKSLEELEAEKRKARAAKFGTSGVQVKQCLW